MQQRRKQSPDMSSPTFTSASPATRDPASTNPRQNNRRGPSNTAPNYIRFLPTCVCLSAFVCSCARWCNNLCSLAHYTVLHRGKWVLSMFLHLNYTTEIIGSARRRRRRSTGAAHPRSRKIKGSVWWLVLAQWNAASPSLFTNQWYFENRCVDECERGHAVATHIKWALTDVQSAIHHRPFSGRWDVSGSNVRVHMWE